MKMMIIGTIPNEALQNLLNEFSRFDCLSLWHSSQDDPWHYMLGQTGNQRESTTDSSIIEVYKQLLGNKSYGAISFLCLRGNLSKTSRPSLTSRERRKQSFPGQPYLNPGEMWSYGHPSHVSFSRSSRHLYPWFGLIANVDSSMENGNKISGAGTKVLYDMPSSLIGPANRSHAIFFSSLFVGVNSRSCLMSEILWWMQWN